MNSKTGGFSSDDKQRRAAAEIARRKVLLAYEQKEVKKTADYIRRNDGVDRIGVGSSGKLENPSTHVTEQAESRAKGVLGVSTAPVLKTVTNEDWKKYHTAWQDYYQKYYSQYYLNAAKQYVAKQQELVTKERPKENIVKNPPKASEIVSALESAEKRGSEDGDGLKTRIRKKAEEKAKSSRKKRLIPVFAGLAVMLAILFLQYNRLLFAPIAAYVSPGNSPVGEINAVDPTVTLTKVSSENKLIIPKLNVDVPLNFGIALDGVMEAMNHGVVHYRINGASAYPGEIGNFVVMGHSAGDIYSSNQYKFIFSGLERLEEGDIMYVHYNSVRYTYRVYEKEIIWPTEVSKLIIDTDKPIMTLVTCWPLGTSRQRLLIKTEQISPSVSDSTVQEDVEDSTKEEELPQNEDTFLDRLKKWIVGD